MVRRQPSVPRSRAVSSHPRNVTLTPGGRTELTHALKQPPKTPSPPGTPWRARGVVGGGVVSFRDRGHLAGRPWFALQNEGLGQVTGPGWDKPRCDLHTQRILDSHYRDGGSDAFSVIYRRPRMPHSLPPTHCLDRSPWIREEQLPWLCGWDHGKWVDFHSRLRFSTAQSWGEVKPSARTFSNTPQKPGYFTRINARMHGGARRRVRKIPRRNKEG